MALRTGDGRRISLSAGDAGADRLGHAYATTVHRSQGATTTRAHLFADGGGRELAYVAMSRAREGTHVWTVADDLAQAREDLAREWSSERRPTWAIDTGLPDPGQLDRTALATLPVGDRVRAIAVVGAQARLGADAMRAALPPDPAPRLGAATATLARLRRERADLESGTGAYGQTAAGQAVRDLRDALAELDRPNTAQHGRSWRGRRTRQAEPAALTGAAGHAQRRWDALVAPSWRASTARLPVPKPMWDNWPPLCNAIEQLRGTRPSVAQAERSSRARSRAGCYRDQLDGFGRPARTPAPRHMATVFPRPSPAYGPITEPDVGPSL